MQGGLREAAREDHHHPAPDGHGVPQALAGQGEHLAPVCSVDVDDRKLAKTMNEAVQDLRSIQNNLNRAILSEILFRSHFLMYWATKNGCITREEDLSIVCHTLHTTYDVFSTELFVD